jgi:hypothetical protein
VRIWCWLPVGGLAMYLVVKAWQFAAGDPPQALYTVLDVAWIAVTFSADLAPFHQPLPEVRPPLAACVPVDVAEEGGVRRLRPRDARRLRTVARRPPTTLGGCLPAARPPLLPSMLLPEHHGHAHDHPPRFLRRRASRPGSVRPAQRGSAVRGAIVAAGLVAAVALQLAGPRLQCRLADLVGISAMAPSARR